MKEIKHKFYLKSFDRKNISIIAGLLAVLLGLLIFSISRDTDRLITHMQANALYTENKIQKVILDEPYIRLYTGEGRYKIYKEAINQNAFFSKYPVEVRQKSGLAYVSVFLLIVLSVFGLMFWFFSKQKFRQSKGFGSILGDANELPAYEPIQALASKVKFSDVAGIKDVKEELEEIIDFLKEPQKYRDFGIRLPKGVLLVGPPGVGKTLISKAVAGEAGVPFFYQSGASFVHIYVGMGAKRVSELFRKAKQMAPSIIFIDEIDAVGKSRGALRNDEREATLNQLLTEMDGFEESSGVIVIGATNKIDVLDEALLRAGRFDRRIHISLPDLQERAKTLELYLKNKPNEVDIEQVARMTVGFNSAALSTLTNEAAIYAMREGRRIVKTDDFEAVKEKVLLGKRKILSFTEEERAIQARYQAAKALIATWLDVEFEKIGIVNSRFITLDHEILSKTQLLSRIKVYLAGSIAVKMYYNEQFTNASSDISKARKMAKKVIYEYGMGENLIVASDQEEQLLSESVSSVTSLFGTLSEALDKINDYLLVHENITQEECREILREMF
ncbi:MAG: ATP-dependent metallopeptidase FtsH/Yme1/Tma family protein [Sulfurovum sp.]|nr:ATP-dependent metallopeptidase FtsH/Yme1/Tma family protein [Sulfurovum sp.]